MRLMTKQYGPRDLREACAMPREDAVWIMEHCADVWEAQVHGAYASVDAGLSVRIEELEQENADLRHSLKLARDDKATQWLEISSLRKRLEKVEKAAKDYMDAPNESVPKVMTHKALAAALAGEEKP